MLLAIAGLVNFRPTFKYYSWHSALLGAVLNIVGAHNAGMGRLLRSAAQNLLSYFPIRGGAPLCDLLRR